MLLPLLFISSIRLVAGHASIWTPAMFGFNVTQQTFSYDNRPVTPLVNMSFRDWWFHKHIEYPPHPEDYVELCAGKNVTLEIACNKGATTYYASSEGGNIQNPDKPNDVCPGSPPSEYHTTGPDDLAGCGLGIAYKSNVYDVQPEDFVIFSVNHTCVWNRYTDFGVPKRMPPCPAGGCICAFFWIHNPDSGSEQMYMNGFQCNVTGSTSSVPLGQPKVARRCGADPANGKLNAVPGNCTWGPKQPLYWLQAEGNNMFEGYYSPPVYNARYNFADGAQNDIFQDSYISIPVPGPNQTALPVPANPGVVVSDSSPGGNSTTPATPSHTTSASLTSSATPSATPSSTTDPGSECTRTASSSSRRNVLVDRRTPFTHRLLGMTRRSRTHNAERRSDLWKPF